MTVSYHHEQEKQPQEQKQSLLDAPGVRSGTGIEWKVGNAHTELTAREIELVKQKCGTKTVNIARVLTIKNMMRFKTISQIAKEMKGRKGYSERYVAAIHAALSQSKGEGF